ncbi:MAG: NAD-dependent DNA ligase LigA [Bacteroidota bacterium]
MNKTEAREKAGQLREAIRRHDHRYYIENDPVISDNKYDEIFKYLQDIEQEFPEIKTKTSPTQKVGAPPVDSLKKRKHKAPMLSLNSSDKEQDVRNFIQTIQKNTEKENVRFYLEPKFDGLSVEVVYEEGKFQYAATRGDGETGEDISENVKTINSVPLELLNEREHPAYLSVRGEIFISKKGFQDINKLRIEKGENPFANARNTAAGLIRQLDPGKVADKPLEVFFYEVIDSNNGEFENYQEMLHHFEQWGLKTNHENKTCRKTEEVIHFFEKLKEKRENLPYEIDGMVIKLNERHFRSELGSRNRSPRWAYAWKFEPQKETTLLIDIIVQVGRTGILTPVALLEPVEVGGVTVSRATLHNEDEVNKKDVRPGDKVKVIRAGDVIPEIAERVEKKKGKRTGHFQLPGKCPVCNTPTVREGAYVVCPAGLSCIAQLKGKLIHYASRNAMNIENLGEKIIGQLVDQEMITDIPGIYQLEIQDLEKLEGIGKKSAEKLYQSIQDSKEPELTRFIFALGIRHVGRHIAKLLAFKYKTLERIVDAKREDLSKTDEIGDEIAESISHFFGNKKNRKMIQTLKELGMKVKEEKTRTSDKFEGKTFVLTGELEKYTRDEAKEKIEQLGGRATSSVSDNTDYLVLGEGPGSKLDEAKKRNVKILSEKEFRQMQNDNK